MSELLQRLLATAAIGAALLVTSEGILWLLLLCAGARALSKEAPAESDARTLRDYVLLVIILSAMCLIPVQLGP